MIKYNPRTIIVMALILFCTIVIDEVHKFYLEKNARISAKYSLNNIKTCVNDLVLSEKKGGAFPNTPITNDMLERALKTCARNSLTTPTGDVFAFDLKNSEFIFDPSLDCFIEGGKYFTPESECSIHFDKVQCGTAITRMSVGYDSSPLNHLFWRFHRGKEYLEWVVLPAEDKGFDGLSRGNNKVKPHQIVVAQGIQEDELLEVNKPFSVVLYIIGFISILINLLLATSEKLIILKNKEINSHKGKEDGR